jgi:hypothetical protein
MLMEFVVFERLRNVHKGPRASWARRVQAELKQETVIDKGDVIICVRLVFADGMASGHRLTSHSATLIGDRGCRFALSNVLSVSTAETAVDSENVSIRQGFRPMTRSMCE